MTTNPHFDIDGEAAALAERRVMNAGGAAGINLRLAKELVKKHAGEGETLESLTKELRAYLASTETKLDDDWVIADQDENYCLNSAVAILWAVEEAQKPGAFSYLVEMSTKAHGRYGLSIGQIRGTLNTMRADAIRQVKASEPQAFRDAYPQVVAALKRAAEQARLKAEARRVRASEETFATSRILLPVGDKVIKLYPAGPSSRHAGDIQVASEHFGGDYYGRLDGRTGEADSRLAQHADILAVLYELEQNPSEKIREFSQIMGRCGICGRGLTNEKSRLQGIGPICAQKVGW